MDGPTQLVYQKIDFAIFLLFKEKKKKSWKFAFHFHILFLPFLQDAKFTLHTTSRFYLGAGLLDIFTRKEVEVSEKQISLPQDSFRLCESERERDCIQMELCMGKKEIQW